MNRISPLVSVLMSVYNGKRYLRESIESILDQTFQDFEFVIVDDASTDNSVDIIRSYRDSRIRLVENDQNLGQTRSLNIGLRKAEGQYIARLDQDDIALETRLEEQVRFLDLNNNVAIVGSYLYNIDSEGTIIGCVKELTTTPGLYFKPFVIGRPSVAHPLVMYRKKNVEILNGYNEDYYYGQDLCLFDRMLEVGYEFANIPKVLTLYRRKASCEIPTKRNIVIERENCTIHAKFITKQLGRTIKPEQLVWLQPSRLREFYNQRNNSFIQERLKIIIEISDLYFTKYPQEIYEKLKLISGLWVYLVLISIDLKKNIGRVFYNNSKVCSKIIRKNFTDNRFPLILLSLSFYALNIKVILPELLTKFRFKIGRFLSKVFLIENAHS